MPFANWICKFMKRNNTFICFLFLSLFAPALAAKSPGEIQVEFNHSQTLRQLAKKYLHNPDLWPDILRANGIGSPDELKPGTKLNIPVAVILQVEQAITRAADKIDQATRTGARLFAAEHISQAIRTHGDALESRSRGEWKKVLQQAEIASHEAGKALEISQANRNFPAQARLESYQGKVQRRSVTDLYWKAIDTQAALVEQDKVRTLSDSFADILFHDESQVHLNENSQIAIRKIRIDRLNNKETADVVLYGGDIYTLLSHDKQKKKLSLEAAPGVGVKVNSRNFWVARNQGNTRFANYEGEMEVSSGGTSVKLKENQGTLVRSGEKPLKPKDLLPPPQLLQPQDNAIAYKKGVSLAWSKVPEASAYWLQISGDSKFSKLELSRKDISQTAFFLPLPEDGFYYWRIAAIDKNAFPGVWGKSYTFKVQRDNQIPYLTITEPVSNGPFRQAEIHLKGQTESGAKLILNGERSLLVDATGEFAFTYALTQAENSILLEASDPAGNRAQLTKVLRYLPDREIKFVYDGELPRLAEKHFIVKQNIFTLKGQTAPDAVIKAQSKDQADASVSVLSDKQGNFTLNLTASKPQQVFELNATLPTGLTVQDSFNVTLDSVPPRIMLDPLPPAYTAATPFNLQGKIEDGVKLSVNGQAVILDGKNAFSFALNLKKGENVLQVKAWDKAGNSAVWQKNIILDQEPPLLLEHQVTPVYANAGEVQIMLKVSDDSATKAGAPFELRVGNYTQQGYLRLCPQKDCYRAKVNLPPNIKGKPRLQSVILEDYLGNRKSYTVE